MADSPGLANQVARFTQEVDHPFLGCEHSGADERLVGRLGSILGQPRRFARDPAIPTQNRSRGQPKFAPPRDVSGITECADHGDP